MTSMIQRMNRAFAWCIIALMVTFCGTARGAHIAGANISYTCTGGNFYNISLDIYASCATAAFVGTQSLRLHNSCGVFFQISGIPQAVVEEVSPVCPSQLPNTTCQTGGTLPGYRHFRFTTTNVYLSACDYWTIQWTTCCRDETENIQNTPGIHAEATLNNATGVCDNSPVFADNGVPFVCLGAPVSYNPGVSDPNGNVLNFSLIAARFDSISPVLYDPGFSGNSPIPGVSINSTTGQLLFTPVVSGRYVLVVRVNSYDISTGQLIGTVMRDLMFFVTVCDGSPPIPAPSITVTGSVAAVGPSSVALCNGQSFCVNLVVSDPNVGTILQMTSNASTILPGSTFTVTGTNPATGRLCWTANTTILPANVYINISDGACPVENTASRSIFVGNCALLPVVLLGFSAKVEGSTVALRWSTASESNSDHYLVERSEDGTVFFDIGRVGAAGTTNTTMDYKFLDPQPIHGTSYYRIRQVDTDERFTFSPTVPVEYGIKNNVLAIRQEARGWNIVGLDANASWQVLDALGREVNVATPQATSDGLWVETGYDQDQLLIFTVTTGGRRITFRLPPTAKDGAVIGGLGL